MKSEKIKDIIASELTAFLLNENITPECIEVNVRYKQSNARLNIDGERIAEVMKK